VAASTALLTSLACALESLNAGIEQGVSNFVGTADLRLKRVGEDRFDIAVQEKFDGLPGVRAVAPRARGAAAVRRAPTSPNAAADAAQAQAKTVQAMVTGIDPLREPALGEQAILPANAGRHVEKPGEVVLDAITAGELNVRVRDAVETVGPAPRRWTIVGLTPGLPFKQIKRPEATVALESLWEVTGFPGRVNEIRIALNEGQNAESLAKQWSQGLPKDLYVEPTAGITSGIKKKTQAAGLVYLLVSTLGFIASAFIVLTGLTTNLLERQRELAVMRCIGATRGQLFASQLGVGAALGTIGAAIGVPVGAGLVFALISIFPDRFAAGFHVSPVALISGVVGAILAGIGGALWPALRASRSRPLGAVTSHAHAVGSKWVWLCAAAGVAGLSWQLVSIFLISDAQASFWTYALTGLPSMFIGYFLLGVPLCLLVSWACAPVIASLLRMPPALLGRFTAQHPFRNGFTAGALMIGLAMMTVIWTVGGSVFRDFLGGFKFPDAFVQSWNGFDESTQRKIEAIPGVKGTCAVSLVRIENAKSFGVTQFGTRRTTFIAFEPEPFFRLVNLRFEAGDPAYAQRRLQEGGAVLVAKEFLIAQNGYKVGDAFPITHKGVKHDFEIVGAVSSPGLEVVNAFFDIGKQYAEESVSAVFGSRADLKRVFGSEAIHLIQVSLDDANDDAGITRQLREVVGPAAVVGSAKEVKATIAKLGQEGLLIASIVAVAAMFIACFGVGNIVVAGIDARRFEFGVLRAVGAQRSLLTRLVLGEVVLVSLTACGLGTMLGLQASLAGSRMHHMLLGIDTRVVPPWIAIGCGCVILTVLALLSAWPSVRALGRVPTRELVAGRG
jgi:putative ABC transport system permease protein